MGEVLLWFIKFS